MSITKGQAERMAAHFLSLHADPVEICPHDSEDGYQYLWGGPVNEFDWLREHYPDVALHVIEDACDLIDPNIEGIEWAVRPEPKKIEEPKENVHRFYKTVFVVEVLSQGLPVDNMALSEVLQEAEIGEFSAIVSDVTVTGLTAKEAAEELIKQSSDPEFFGLDKEGNDLGGEA